MIERAQDTVISPVRQEAPTADGRGAGLKARHWLVACAILLAVTWVPLLSVHLYRTTLDDAASGTVVVVFPPFLSSKTVFQKVVDADGAMVRPVTWARHMWMVRSVDAGFAGRLRASGAWGVYSTDLLSADALWSCLRITRASPTKR